jgi:hypothetical protein
LHRCVGVVQYSKKNIQWQYSILYLELANLHRNEHDDLDLTVCWCCPVHPIRQASKRTEQSGKTTTPRQAPRNVSILAPSSPTPTPQAQAAPPPPRRHGQEGPRRHPLQAPRRASLAAVSLAVDPVRTLQSALLPAAAVRMAVAVVPCPAHQLVPRAAGRERRGRRVPDCQLRLRHVVVGAVPAAPLVHG